MKTRYHIPTHLSVPDRIALPMLLFTVQLTVRQFFVLFAGYSYGFTLWNNLVWLDSFGRPGWTLHIGMVGGWAVVITTLVMVRVAGQELDAWLVVIWRYWYTPHLALWYSVRLLPQGEATGEKKRIRKSKGIRERQKEEVYAR